MVWCLGCRDRWCSQVQTLETSDHDQLCHQRLIIITHCFILKPFTFHLFLALRIGLYEKVRNQYMELCGVEPGLGWGMLGVRW